MPEFMEVLTGRRSIRNYVVGRDVPEPMLDRVLDAVRWSPSWANTQCWEIVVVKDPETKKRLQQTLSKGNPATRAMVEAPVVLVLCAKREKAGYYGGQATTKFGDWFMFDLGIATQTLCLAAHAIGLGTVIAGLYDHGEVSRLLGIPGEYENVVMIPIGFAARGTGAPKRKEIGGFAHRERFGS